MHITVVFDHNPNTEEIAAHGTDPQVWESMFFQYLRDCLSFDPAITTVAEVHVSPGQIPTAPDPKLLY